MKWTFLRVAFAAALLSGSTLAAAADFKILHAETIATQAKDLPADAGADPFRLSFQAYGRQFELSLTSNAQLLSRMPAAQKSAWARFPLYRGIVVGREGSWVRLTRVSDELHGAFWDGTDLYTVAPARAVAPYALQSLNASGSDLVVYRLSDTESALDTAFCGVGPEQRSDSAGRYDALIGELRKQFAAAAAVAVEQIEVAFIADFEFRTRFPASTEGDMLARVNVVDGIFDAQVGVAIVPAFQVFTDSSDPFTTTVPADLLAEVGSYRQTTPAIRARGLAHLMTGRDLDGNTAGIAFLDSLCEAFGGVGLSESSGSVTVAALIAAHEIGHNFNAPHDGEAGSPCESTPQTFLMAPRITGSSTFSQCSLDEMRAAVASASCITPVATADAGLTVPGGTISAVTGTAFNLNVDVTSLGTTAVNGVVVTATPGANLTVDSAIVPGGTCTTGANSVVTCNLGNIAAAASRRITLTLRGTAVGATQIAVSLMATNDGSAQNNSGVASVSIGAAVTPPPPPPPGNDGGGGSGALQWFVLAGLLGACVARRKVSVSR